MKQVNKYAPMFYSFKLFFSDSPFANFVCLLLLWVGLYAHQSLSQCFHYSKPVP